MPYLLHVVKGKEKRVIEVFGHHGVAAKKALIGEYVVTYDPKFEELRYLDSISGYIRNISPIEDEEVGRFLGLSETVFPKSRMETGCIVRILSGEYQGLPGDSPPPCGRQGGGGRDHLRETEARHTGSGRCRAGRASGGIHSVKGSGRIVGYAVNRKTISVRIEMSGAAPIIDELNQYKGKMKTIRLDTFQLVGKIESITISKNVGFLVHMARLDFINRRLFRLMEKEPLVVEVSTTQQDKLLYFLDTIARKRSRKPEDLLFELTSFKKRDGNGPGQDDPRQEVCFRSLRGPVERRLRQDQQTIGY